MLREEATDGRAPRVAVVHMRRDAKDGQRVVDTITAI